MKGSSLIRSLWNRDMVGLLTVLLALSFAGYVAQADGKQVPRETVDTSGLVVTFTDGHLTVKAANTPTATVLRRIARDAGVNIIVYGEPKSTISIEFEKLPLDAALRRVLGQYNLVLLYKEVDDPANAGRKARLTEAQVHVGSGVAVPTMEFAAGRVMKRTAVASKLGDRKHKSKRNKKRGRTKESRKLASGSDEDAVEVLARLKTAAFDSDPTVRADAVDDLSLVEDERAALDILERVLREDPDAEVRANAIGGLEDLDEVPVEPVLDAVLFDEAPEVRIGAMEIIGEQEWKDQRTVDTLSRVLHDPNEEMRLAALEVLGELGERTVLEVVAKSNPHEEIRQLAAELLAVLKQ